MRAVVLACLLSLGCDPPCPASADIQFTLLLDGVDRSAISQLVFGLTVNNGATRQMTVTPMRQLNTSTTILLRPDPAPAQVYTITLTVEALDSSGYVQAIGSISGSVSASGCNRMELRLTSLPMTDAGPIGADAMLFDLSQPEAATDLSICAGGTPDEDADGRADFCDVCAADADPTPMDSDADGVPDACDPDQAKTGNRVVYFEPFNVDNGHWSAPFTVTGGSLNGIADPSASKVSADTQDALPDGVQVETYVTAPFLQGTGGAQMGIFLGDSNLQNGALCTISYKPGGTDTLDLDTVANGVITATTSSPLPFGNDVVYRFRLTQRGMSYTCEGVALVSPSPLIVTVPATIAGPAAPHYAALRILNVEAHFLNVFAVTAQ